MRMKNVLKRFGLMPLPKKREKNRPICPECGEATIVLFTPPKEPRDFNLLGTPEYIDWKRAHVYCCNGSTNCKYEVLLMGGRELTTP